MSYLISGIDEVGRGSLAGPIIAVATLFRASEKREWSEWGRDCPIPGVKDSKQFSDEKKREVVYHAILRCPDLVDFGIGECSVEEIEKEGIDWANKMVFYKALKDLHTEPNYVLVDGDNPVPVWDRYRQTWKPKADAMWWPVGAASVLAKVIRDRMMAEFHVDYPYYAWDKNAGYGTPAHQKGIKTHGPTPLHRSQFIKKLLAATPDTGHHCHADGCVVPTKPEMLMCLRHWKMVPKDLQQAVWATYRPGQCDDKRPSKEWHDAADAAIAAVANKEHKNKQLSMGGM